MFTPAVHSYTLGNREACHSLSQITYMWSYLFNPENTVSVSLARATDTIGKDITHAHLDTEDLYQFALLLLHNAMLQFWAERTD